MENRFLLWEKELYRTIYTMLLVCVTLFGAGKYLGVASPGRVHVIIAVVFIALLILMEHFGLKGKLFGLLGFLGVGVAAITVVGPEETAGFLASYGKWLLGMPGWQQDGIPVYEMLQVVFLTLLCYLLQLVLEKDFRCKVAFSCLIILGLILLFFMKQEFSKAGMAAVFCYLLFTLVEWTQRNWNKIKTQGLRSYMIWMAPFALCYLLVLSHMPAPEKPYEWKTVRHLYHKVSESLNQLSFKIFSSGNSDYGTVFSGFSDNGVLWDSYQGRYKEVMQVTGNNSKQRYIYLTGKVFDTFDGKKWTLSQTDFSGERYADAVRTISAVKEYDAEYYTDYVYRADINIKYKYLNSYYLFAPQKAWFIEQQYKELPLVEKEGSLQFKKKAGFDTAYHVVYYQLNNGSEVFERFIEEAEAPEEETLQKVIQDFYRETGVKLTLEQMKHQEELVQKYCTDKPVLSDELQKYLEQINGDAGSDMDKLKALEKELSSFTYSNNPGRIPNTVQDASAFLEYFLLEGKEGFCNHFATAFVLLARAQGIPARYVQGYLVPVDKGGPTVVTSGNAHAWPEVYVENVGWISFEPTPGYGAFRYAPWVAKQELDAQKEEHADVVGSMPSVQDWQREEETKEEVSLEDLERLEAERVQKRREQLKSILKIFLISMGILLVTGILLLLTDFFVRRYHYRKMTVEQKYNVLLKKNLKLLSKLGFTRNTGETVEEFTKRLREEFSEKSVFLFLEQYEEFLYGRFFITKESVRILLEEQCTLLNFLKQRKKFLYKLQYYTIFLYRDVL